MTTSSTRMDAVKAVVWKEWRERFLWALITALALSFFLARIAVSAAKDAEYGRYSDVWSMIFLPLSLSVLLITGLGYLQMSNELRRDKWAFLTHRPATPALLLWAKVFAGLSLFCLVTILPYAGFLWWIAQPGRLPAPFDWRLGGVRLIILSFGVLFYFAGALTALRDRPWWGSRALPIFAALACFFAFIGSQVWWQGWLNLAVASGAAAWATYGCFAQRTGRSPSMRLVSSRFAQASLGAVLYGGMWATFAIILILATAFFGGLWTPPQQLTDAYSVTGKGEVFRAKVPRFSNGVIKEESQISDLKGRVLARGSEAYYDFVGKKPGVSFSDIAQNSRLPNMFFGFETFFRKLPAPSQGGERWYLDREKRHIVGYSLSTRLPIGYVGTNGFARNVADVKPFADSPKQMMNEDVNLIVMARQIYNFDASARKVTKIVDLPDEITGARRSVWNDVVVLTKKKIFIVSEEGKPLFSTPWLQKPNRFDVAVAQTSKRDRFWIRYTPRVGDEQAPTTLVEYSRNGQEVKRHILPTIPNPLALERTHSSDALEAFVDAPAMKLLGETRKFLAQRETSTIGANEAKTSEVPQQYPDFFVLNLTLSAIAAFLAHLRARRYAFKSSTRWAWTIGVLLLGPLGFPLMIALLDWPRREKCASCAKLRVVNRENCEHCGSSFSTVVRDGTEIYDDDETARTVSARGEKLVAL